MTTRSQFIAQASTWLKTPYHHQGRVKGVGVDCIGLLVCVAEELGIDCSDVPTNYSRAPDAAELFRSLSASGHVSPTDTPRPGDIAFFRIRGQPTHFGLLTDFGFIHADQTFGVVEVPMDAKWAGRVIANYKINHLEDA